MIPVQLVDIFIDLQSPKTRKAGLEALASYADASGAYLFGKDAELDVFLPADGLSQTMRYATRWQAVFAQCPRGACTVARLPAPWSGEDVPCSVVVEAPGNSILVLFGVELPAPLCTQLVALLPLTGTKLVDERAAASAAGHAAVARSASAQAKSLNIALDRSRRELQQAFAQLEKELAIRRDVENKLRHADRRKDEFLAMLAHELRNPLAPIKTAAHMIAQASLEPAQIEQAGRIINRQAAHMIGLLDDLLDVSRVTRGKITLEKQPVDMKAAVGDAIEQSRPQFHSQHRLGCDLAADDVYVQGDKTRIVQIVANILVNAAKYTPPPGSIDLRLEATPDTVIVTVRDTGIGIDADLMPHIFELFAQAPRGADRSQGGLGIGLALARNLAELHGGSIAAHSEGADRGTTFTVRLPRLAQAPEASVAAREADTAISGIALEIVVVDDNVDAATTLALYLRSLGHRTETTYSGESALALARSGQLFDMMFLDIGLPDLSGYELARQLKDASSTSACVLVALTGYGQLQDKELARKAGFDFHLTKPADFRELDAILEHVVDRKAQVEQQSESAGS